MPSQLWSNPNPAQGANGAELASRAHVDGGNSASVIAAILADRYRKQQQFQDTLAQVQKATGDQRDYDLRSKLIEAQVNNYNTQSDMLGMAGGGDSPQTYTKDGIHYMLGPHGWQAISQNATGQPSANQKLIQDRFEEGQAQKQVKQQLSDLNTMGGLTASGGPRITETSLGSETDVHKGVGPGGEYIPDNYYGIGGKQLETIVPSKEFDAAHSGADAYRSMVDQHNVAGVPQEQAQGGGGPSGPPVGTKGTVKGVPAVWDGYGWVAQ